MGGNSITLLTNSPNFHVVKEGSTFTGFDDSGITDGAVFDEDDDIIDSSAGLFNVSDDTVVFDLVGVLKTDTYGGGTFYKIDDPGLGVWETLAKKDNIAAGIKVNKDKVEYVFALYADGTSTISSTAKYAMVSNFSYIGRDDAIVLLNPDNSKSTVKWSPKSSVKRRSFVYYTLKSGGDEIDSIEPIVYEDTTDQPGTVTVVGGVYSTDAGTCTAAKLDSVKFAVVDSVSGNSLKAIVSYSGDTPIYKYFAVTSNTVYYNIDEGKIINKPSKYDYVALVDTDDDGYGIDYVLVIKDELDAASAKAKLLATQ